MIVDEIIYTDQDHAADLLERLHDTVFHLTTKEAFDQIQRDVYIFHNRERRFALNIASENSFGRNRGWVCLFDLRGHPEATIKETRKKYNFLEPSWFKRYYTKYTESHLAYLFLDPKTYPALVSNQTAANIRKATNRNNHYVPKTECWYPGDLPLTAIGSVLLVQIYTSAPTHNLLLYAHHRCEVERERKRRNG